MTALAFAPAAPLPCYGRALRWMTHALTALQAALLCLAAMLLRGASGPLAGVLEQGIGPLLAAGAVFCLGAALVLSRSETRQHLGLATALVPLAGLAGLSLYLN